MHKLTLISLCGKELALEGTNEDAKNAGRGASKSISRAAVVGGEYFRRDSIKHAVHDLQVFPSIRKRNEVRFVRNLVH